MPPQVETTLTSSAWAAPLTRLRLAAGRLPLWQLLVQPALKMGCTWPAKLTVGPQPWQVPPRHISPEAQSLPQPPQLRGSVPVFTQLPPHRVVPLAQLDTQLPLLHELPAAQARPQPPQLAGSLAVFTQDVPQLVIPLEQPQLPLLQALPAGQVLPQPPQFRGSLAVLVQTPPHDVVPAAQVQAPPTQACPPAQG